MSSLTFLLPGLKGPFPGLPGDAIPEYPSLETLLARAGKRRRKYRTFYQHLCGMFGIGTNADRDLPVAALSRLVDDTDRPEGVWMRADPVHLKAGLNDLTLIDTAFIPLTQHDAILLGTPLRDLFNELGWQFEIPIAQRWYVRLDHLLDAVTTEIGEVRGRDVQQYMPAGRDRPKMDRLLTEAQMLLHGNQFNLDRERSGYLTINSLWFWGCGSLPETLNSQWTRVISDDPVAQGLAVLSDIPSGAFYEGSQVCFDEMTDDANILVVKDDMQVKASYQDYNVWQEIIYDMEDKWFGPALTAVRRGDLDRVTIITDNMEYAVTSLSLKKFWCRRRAVLS